MATTNYSALTRSPSLVSSQGEILFISSSFFSEAVEEVAVRYVCLATKRSKTPLCTVQIKTEFIQKVKKKNGVLCYHGDIPQNSTIHPGPTIGNFKEYYRDAIYSNRPPLCAVRSCELSGVDSRKTSKKKAWVCEGRAFTWHWDGRLALAQSRVSLVANCWISMSRLTRSSSDSCIL